MHSVRPSLFFLRNDFKAFGRSTCISSLSLSFSDLAIEINAKKVEILQVFLCHDLLRLQRSNDVKARYI